MFLGGASVLWIRHGHPSNVWYTLLAMLANPLLEYKEKNQLSWRQLVMQTGVSHSTLHRLATCELPELAQCTFSVSLRIRQTIGIDLYDFVEKHVAVQLVSEN